jgi:pimeloyl-ACP methyl ester carboxylesterase
MPSFQHKVFKGLPGKIDANKIVALGHSMGGASAAAAMLLNPNIRGGVNMDGGLFDPVLSHGLDKPFMQLGRPSHRTQDTTWVEFWNSLRGPKVELQIADTVHGSYTDFPLLLKTLGLPKEALKQMEPLFGSVDGEELQKIISQTISAFWTYTFQGKKESLTKVIRESKGLSVVKSQLPE